MKTGWKIAFIFAGIFLAGGVCGGFVSLRIWCKPVPKPPEQFDRQKMQSFIKELSLSEEQQKKVQPIIEQTGLDLQQVRTESRRQARALLERMEADVASVLNDQQREKLKVLQEKARERMRQQQLEREKNKQAGQSSSSSSSSSSGAPTPPSTDSSSSAK
jgi:hypothetical protein